MMRHYMRDDVFGLSTFRQLTDASALSLPSTQRTPTLGTQGLKPSFATALAGAAKARTSAALKPYHSPLKQTHQSQQPTTLHKPTLPRSTTSSSSVSSPSLAKPSTSLKAPQAKPTLPVKPAETVRPPNAAPQSGPLPLDAYPHPNGDNGRGMHWIPTTKQSNAVVDRFVAEAQRMGVKWVMFLNDGANIGDNDYLVSKLVGAGIEPVMRLYSQTLAPIQGDVEGMVRHYVGMGVRYFQPFNEPNLNCENPDGKVSVDRYLDAWLPAAKAIVRGGGLPGFGSLAPGGDFDDQQFLVAALDGLKARGEAGVLDKAWLSMHNYTWNHPIQDRGDGDGFFKFRAYHSAVRQALGRDLPIIGTEGGTFIGEQEDPKMAPVTAGMAADWTRQAFRYMRDQREPWMFASSVWTIADLAGGGSDQRFEAQALFRADGTQNPIVSALQALG